MKKAYASTKTIIKQRLKEFSRVEGDQIFYELCFCLLTPQSNAYKCDECVCALKKRDFLNKNLDVRDILKDKTRFYKNKSGYLKEMKERFAEIREKVDIGSKENTGKNRKIREFLVNSVKGLGYKEASHFLRNIGYRNLAILDRHILKNLLKLNVIDEIPKTVTRKRYLEIEKKFLNYSRKVNIPMDELDLLFWSMETGKVFK